MKNDDADIEKKRRRRAEDKPRSRRDFACGQKRRLAVQDWAINFRAPSRPPEGVTLHKMPRPAERNRGEHGDRQNEKLGRLHDRLGDGQTNELTQPEAFGLARRAYARAVSGKRRSAGFLQEEGAPRLTDVSAAMLKCDALQLMSVQNKAGRAGREDAEQIPTQENGAARNEEVDHFLH